ncbi:MAG: copper oxidase [Pyrinomonadaceae bacterium]
MFVLFATPAAAQERPGFSGSAAPAVSAGSFTSARAHAGTDGSLPPANAGAEVAAEVTAEPAADATDAADASNKEASAAPASVDASPAQPAAAAAQKDSTQQASAPTDSEFRPVLPDCVRTITAKVVAFDQVYTYNRFGAFNPGGMIYALERDVVPIKPGTKIEPGNVQLRPDKRPRPIVLRVNEGDCLQVNFTNLLTPTPEEAQKKEFTNQPDEQPLTKFPIRLRQNDTTFTRTASMHVNGLDYVKGANDDDGANVGRNVSTLAAVGQTRTYTWYAAKQGQYLLYSMGAPAGNEGDNGQGGLGLFGSVNVEPAGARWYRSQVTEKDLQRATKGVNPNGTPKIDYEATYGSGHLWAGYPVLNMLFGNEIIYTDVNALIVGFTEDCTNAPPSGTCGRDFREFSVLFHDELKAVQAFSKSDEEGNPRSPLDAEIFHGVRDGFAVNYGASGLGSIVIANRLKFGPSAECEDCKFEEFFLESWVNGDPALVVKQDERGQGQALFPDDPSNVHHSYLGDPVRFRNVHIGKETHVFHLHAHQWLQSPRFEDSTYLDSQTISPGASYTYEINYGGSGNRNLTPGDAIFHCHLYPHFAQGMWELWRVHDVFENGADDRRLPDAELGSTPNPAIVPLPGLGMPPMPNERFRGYPFYIAAEAGKRPPQPPLDFAKNSGGTPMDGGLPRHIILDAEIIDGQAGIVAEHPALLNDVVAKRVLTTHVPDPDLDLGFTTESPLTAFARALIKADIRVLPNEGTDPEQIAMTFHEGCFGQSCNPAYATFTPEGAASKFFVNGRPRQPGAPFADPCPVPEARPRTYGAAYIQFDMPVNRAKWHDRQARILTLENDALATIGGTRPPEPLFFRANSGECVLFRATNLIPNNLNLDDFQIFTPTDIMGQHIHLVKFDVTSSDGAGNGWNYEDGTFSPGEVQERIKANNKFQQGIGGTQIFTPTVHPKFGAGPDLDGNKVGDYVGAQTTVQRWWADPLLNTRGKDRTLRTVFTHDHFGPSSHQHHGFYGALVVEKAQSTWTALNGTPLGGRDDGGPTSFAANIIDRDYSDGTDDSFREFNLAFADFAIVYRGFADPMPVNPPGRKEADLPIAIEPTKDPRPEAISAADPGTQLINYRNEPIPHRIAPPDTTNQYPAGDPRGDLANAFSSRVHGDPFTPVLPAYERDRAVVRLIQGAQEEQHVFNLHGYKWLFEPGTPEGSNTANNSGYRNGQQIGISEHFEFYLNQPPAEDPAPNTLDKGGTAEKQTLPRRRFTDHLYSSAATDNLWDGQWGILRVFAGSSRDRDLSRDKINPDGSTETAVPDPSDPLGETTTTLARLPNNPETTEETTPAAEVTPVGAEGDEGAKLIIQKPVCREVNRKYGVTAILARDLVPSGQVTYSQKANIFDPNAILLVEDNNLDPLKTGAMQPEPLILRASAGECIAVTLKNNLPAQLPENDSWNMVPMIVNGFNFNQVRTSNRVGLHSQLVAVNTFRDDGANVGFNKDSTVGPGESKTYLWYAGDRFVGNKGGVTHTPIEFGATGLRDMGDVIKHASHGSIGALVIEPEGATWTTDPGTFASADIYSPYSRQAFREFVVLYQTDLALKYYPRHSLYSRPQPLPNIAETDDSEDSGGKAFNYRTEPLWWRLGVDITTPPIGGPDHPGPSINDFDLSNVLSSNDPNPGCGGACGDPETPIFTATAGQAVRFRVLDVAGHPRQHGFTIHGHHWQFEPWENASRVQGFNPRTFDIGSESGIGPTRHVNILTQAGGLFYTTGDFLYRTQESFNFSYGGLWGIFRVNPPRTDPCYCPKGTACATPLWCPREPVDEIKLEP